MKIIINDAKRKAQFDEMGDYNISQSIDLDQPMKGVHDIYDDYEEVLEQLMMVVLFLHSLMQ